MASSHSTSTYESSDYEMEVVRDSEEEEEYVPEEKKRKKKKIIVWSEKDEITILEGLIKLQKSSSSLGKKNNIIHYYSVIKDSLVADVSKEQLTDKVKRLKRKYMQNKKNKLADPNLSIDYDSHSKRVFELSKQIWDECVFDLESGEKKRKEVMVKNKIDDTADDDDNKKKKKKKQKIIKENESESGSGNAFTKLFHEYCEEKGLEVKWLEKEERDSLGNLWKQASQLEWEQGILESKYKKLRYDLDETIYSLLKCCYTKSPALFITHDN
ncbi:transcription factor STKL2 [Ziziphus jujuba]|uniref:Transcription factor STKL2 n=1 Tax=Ziziphus jujuba TaxID=326968 RepID=A0ABM4ADT7_ZIZJJ|nr:transcription factor STKL2 [Ziziphus jujuba]